MTDLPNRRRLLSLLAGVALAGAASPASAQGLFDFLFGSHRAPQPVPAPDLGPSVQPRPKPRHKPKAAKPKPKTEPDAAALEPEPVPTVPDTPGNLRLAVVLPSRGNPFYNASLDGIREAVAAFGNVDMVVASPARGTAAEQIAFVNGFVKQKVDALLIVPVEPKFLGPATRRAMARGIKVVSFDKALPVGTRLAHLDAASVGTRAASFMSTLAGDLKDGGDVAILAGTRTNSDGQALVSITMQQWLKPAYGKLKLAATVFGNDSHKTAYGATQKLLADHPSLKGILAFNAPAMAGAAQAVQDQGLAGQVFVTGFGQPSQLKGAFSARIVDGFASVNPVDLGYGAAEIVLALAKNQAGNDVGSTIPAGRLGSITLGQGNVATLPPFVIDAKNFSKFADVY